MKSSVDECAKAKCLLDALPIVVLPAFLSLIKTICRYLSLSQSKFRPVWLLFQFQCNVRVMSVRPTLESPTHLNFPVGYLSRTMAKLTFQFPNNYQNFKLITVHNGDQWIVGCVNFQIFKKCNFNKFWATLNSM